MPELNKESRKQATLEISGNQAPTYYFKERNKRTREWENIKRFSIIKILDNDAKSGKSLVDALALDRETETPLGIVTAVRTRPGEAEDNHQAKEGQ